MINIPEAQAFDVILLDLPPNLGFQTVNGFAASRWVLIPLQISGFALTGLRQLSHAIRLAQEHLNPELELMGLVPTFVHARTIFSRDLLEALHLIQGTRVFQPYIPYTVRVAAGSLTGLPVVMSSPGSPAARAYAEVTDAIWHVVRSSPAHIKRAPAPPITAPTGPAARTPPAHIKRPPAPPSAPPARAQMAPAPLTAGRAAPGGQRPP